MTQQKLSVYARLWCINSSLKASCCKPVIYTHPLFTAVTVHTDDLRLELPAENF